MLLKQKNLRDFLRQTVPYLAQNPEKLILDIEDGSVEGTIGPSLSHLHSYKLVGWLLDWNGNTHVLVTLIELWLRRHQPDILANPDKRKTGFTYELLDLDGEMQNVNFTLLLTERVIVTQLDGSLNVEPKDEPPLPDGEVDPLDIFFNHAFVIKGVTP
jgi:hypothetical protein